jgi:polyhydroxyalkanoate synthesis repressor PhaR
MTKTKRGQEEPTVIKKYTNRRLYDTGRSSYVTLEDLCEMIKDGYDFVVYDAKSGEDITRSVLTQIIVEQEANGQNLLPTNFMRNLIGFYGDKMQGLVPNYLEGTMDIFVKNQERMKEQISKSLSSMPGMKNVPGIFPTSAALEEMNRQNMAIFERTMKMFAPFGMTFPSADKGDGKPNGD